MNRPLRLALVSLGLALAVSGTASLTGGWLGTPPWWSCTTARRRLRWWGGLVRVVATTERKGAAAPGTLVTDADVAEAQRLVDGLDAFFRTGVRDARELGAKEASAVWTGSVWLAGEAKSLGLVDRVEPLDAAVERLAAPLRTKSAKARLGAMMGPHVAGGGSASGIRVQVEADFS